MTFLDERLQVVEIGRAGHILQATVLPQGYGLQLRHAAALEQRVAAGGTHFHHHVGKAHPGHTLAVGGNVLAGIAILVKVGAYLNPNNVGKNWKNYLRKRSY